MPILYPDIADEPFAHQHAETAHACPSASAQFDATDINEFRADQGELLKCY
jgi:hypothetical protein